MMMMMMTMTMTMTTMMMMMVMMMNDDGEDDEDEDDIFLMDIQYTLYAMNQIGPSYNLSYIMICHLYKQTHGEHPQLPDRCSPVLIADVRIFPWVY